MSASEDRGSVLVLGIGNVLMGDEGIGVHVVNRLQELDLPDHLTCLDGGTGGFALLGAMGEARRIVMIDATIDGAPSGSVRRLCPRFSRDYPRTLTAHDIGLKDLLDVLYLTDSAPDVTLFAVSIEALQEVGAPLSSELSARVPEFVALVLEELGLDAAAERRAVDAAVS